MDEREETERLRKLEKTIRQLLMRIAELEARLTSLESPT